MRAEQTRYVVPGWGVGELWTKVDAVLAHGIDYAVGAGLPSAFRSGAAAGGDVALAGPGEIPAARPHEGAASPPTGTLPVSPPRVGHVSVSTSGQAVAVSGLVPAELVARFTAFLEGADVSFDDVRLDLEGYTPFQRAVAVALRRVPRGEVVSYGELAALAGFPGAQRAVGTFCARNRFALILPCHRIVGAHGIGGYGSAGVAVKRRLLWLEGVVL